MNRGSRICSPMPYHLAMAPCQICSAPIQTALPVVFSLRKSSLWRCHRRALPAVKWSGRRGSNSLPPPWQGGALPDELRPLIQSRRTLSHSPGGASGRNRTNDTWIFSPLLYQLSYRGKCAFDVLVGTTGLEPVTPCL